MRGTPEAKFVVGWSLMFNSNWSTSSWDPKTRSIMAWITSIGSFGSSSKASWRVRSGGLSRKDHSVEAASNVDVAKTARASMNMVFDPENFVTSMCC